MKLVKCKLCEKYFDREKEPFVRIGARYAHKACQEKKEEDIKNANLVVEDKRQKEKEQYREILDFAKKHFGQSANYPLIQKQIHNFIVDNGYSYNGIYKTLVYYYDIKKNPTDKANGGIGIVPYVYEEAKRYYYYLYLTNNKNEEKEVKNESITVVSKPIQKKKDLGRLFSFLDEEEENGK